MLRDVQRIRESEEIIQPVCTLKRPDRVGVRKTGTPSPLILAEALIRTIDLELERVVPRLLVVRRVDEVAVAVGSDVEALAARSIVVEAELRPVHRELIVTANSGVRTGNSEASDCLTKAKAPTASTMAPSPHCR